MNPITREWQQVQFLLAIWPRCVENLQALIQILVEWKKQVTIGKPEGEYHFKVMHRCALVWFTLFVVFSYL